MAEITSTSPKMKLMKYLSTDKTGKDGSMVEKKEAMEVIEEFAQEKMGKSTKEMTAEEQETFFNWAAKGTPLEAEIREQVKVAKAA